MSTWSCPHQTGDYFCLRVKKTCEPGMKGCVLRGKVHFAKDEEPIPGPSANAKNNRKRSKAS